MDLGTFSISLTVKDLAASKAFYEKSGFIVSRRTESSSISTCERERACR